MDKANSADAERLQSLAKQHLMLHFSDMSASPSATSRSSTAARAATSSTSTAAATSTASPASTASTSATPTASGSATRRPRRCASCPFTSNWTVAHPPGIELATRLSELAPARPRPRLLRLRRSRRRRVGLEARGPVARGQRRTGAAQGDRPQGRVPRGLAGGIGDDRDRGMPDPVRTARGAGLPRLQHERLPPPGGRGRTAPLRRPADRDRGDDRRRRARRRSR